MDFPVRFDNPWALLLILLVIPMTWYGWRTLTGQAPLRRSIVCGVRAMVVIGLALTLAEPRWEQRNESLTLVMLIDRTRSISRPLEAEAYRYLRTAVEAAEKNDDRKPEDRLAIINIGAEARVEQMADRATVVDLTTPVINQDATNLADGLRMAMAVAPRDSSLRFVLVSDGNENIDNVMAVADIARANGIPVDVLPLRYDHTNEVMFDRIQTQSQAREGQNVTLNLILRARRATTGQIVLFRNDEPVDLDPESPAVGLAVNLNEGVNTFRPTIPMDRPGPQRLRAEFQPDILEDDAIASNNRAETVVIVGGEGRVLLVRSSPTESAALEQALTDAQIKVDAVEPSSVADDLMVLSGYDSIILANIPAHVFPTKMHETLRLYVHEIGGGLVMIGGPETFGAGGWIDTDLEKALPVRLDPPDKTQMPRGALVCIMHSSEIPQGNYWAEQCAIGAIEALSRLDLAGVIDFDWGRPGVNAGCDWVVPLQEVGDKTAAINAIKKMTMGDMPDFPPAMSMALQALQQANAGQKHVIIISDGDPQRPTQQMLQQFVDSKISISTVVAGGHGNPADAQTMQWIATTTGGEFYNPTNPNQYKQIFIKEAMVIKRSLIVEGEVYQPIHRLSVKPGPFVGRWANLPTLDGYVLTAPRPGHDPELVTENGDPILAFWQYGVGRSIAFTSDATTRWSSRWNSWSGFQQFLEQTVRWTMRPAAPSNVLLKTRLEGDRAVIEVEALTAEGSFATFGTVSGVLVTPSLDAKPIRLQQVGPGQWRAETPVDEQGTYVVNLVREDQDGRKTPIQAGISNPYSQELRDLEDNVALLTEVAERTGGVILPEQPESAQLFRRENLPRPAALTDLWPLLAIIAATLFLFDVATRRLAIDPRRMRGRLAALMGSRASSAGAGMDRLKEARGQARDQLEPRDARESKRVASTTFDADESVATPIDLDATGDPEPGLKSKPRRETRAEPAAEGESDESYTSRLLRAKRRAKGGDSESEPPDGGSAE
ncbi:MAG: VWA domain-containing protein [Phycisphaerales bacterium]